MIRLLIPDMPTADELLPFLRRIDAEKRYSNGGVLVRELEKALAELVHAPTTAVSNGTVAIELALRALRLPRGAAVAIPAMTFVATGQAVCNAQLKPVLCDVDPVTWQLTPEAVVDAADGMPIRAAIPVASFGMPVPIEPWERFARDTRMPVVIDAAGALTAQVVSQSPSLVTTFSLHATKFVGAGEGGAVATTDRMLLRRIAEMKAFGHWGTNAKMSEYHAAVALASLAVSRMSGKLGRNDRVARSYFAGLADIPGIALQQPSPRADGTLLPVLMPAGRTADHVQDVLASIEIESKQWYRPFLDELQQFGNCSRPMQLPTTQMLRERMLGLPYHGYLTEVDIATVCSALETAVR